MTFEELIGSRLVFGIPGTKITLEIVRHFKETHAGGLILYRINFESPEQTRTLISDLENALERRLLVCTDHEGGRVIMFGEGVTIFPSAQAFGKTGDTQLARRQGEQEGKELRRLGIDVNFAPVLDVLTEVYSPNIGIRSFGSDPDLVAKMGAARISAMQVEGLSACAKHFPGLGPANLDPHLNMPTINVTWDELERVHMLPFHRAMRTAVHSIMTSHPLYPNLDPSPRTPATFSRKIVFEYLRQKTGYKGVIFSDDLEMGAITELCPIGEAAVLAARAGHDVLLSCHDLVSQRKVFDALVEACKNKHLSTKEMEESVQRISTLKAYRGNRFADPPGTPARAERERSEAQALVKEICDRSVTVIQSGEALSSSLSTCVIAPRYSDFASKIMIEKAMLPETPFLESLVSAHLDSSRVKPEITLVSLEPSENEIEAAKTAASAKEQTLLLLFDAHIYPAEQKLLHTVQAAARRLVIVLLRDAYDREFVQAGKLCLTNYGYRIADLTVVLDKAFAPSTVTTSS